MKIKLMAAAIAALVASALPQAQAQVQQAAYDAENPGMVVVKDKETGELRAATGDEIKMMEMNAGVARAKAAKKVSAPKEIRTKKGLVGIEVPKSNYSYSVVTIAADGSLQKVCVEGEEAAEHAVHSHQLAKPVNQVTE